MRKLWLIFAQTVTVSLAVLFVISTLKPDWLVKSPGGGNIVALQQTSPASGEPAAATSSYREAVKRALPSVVHIFTSQKVKAQRHPLLDDPIFRHFFGERPEGESGDNAQRTLDSAPGLSSAAVALS